MKNENIEKKLNKCPFCGGRASVVRGFSLSHPASKAFYKIYCKNCQVRQVIGRSLKDKMKEWNIRRK